MRKEDYSYLGVLAALAVYIWIRDLTWMSSIEDTLPIVVAIPMLIWIEWPWNLSSQPFEISKWHLSCGVLLLILGLVSSLTILLAIAWTLLLWSWMKKRLNLESHPHIFKLMVLPLMAFPWITLDAFKLGWWFRLSGAWATGHIFSFAGFDVTQQGTHILVNNLPVSVDLSCAGLNSLQSMLIAGTLLAYTILGDRRRYWLNILFLFVMAWISNTLRISMICAAALTFSPEFAMGPFHKTGGWLLLCLMFFLCWGFFTLQQPKSREQLS